MKTLNKIWNSIKNLNLTNYKVINGTMESKKFRLILDFDGILKQGNNMTINQLADIVNNLAEKVDEGFRQVNKRLDRIESRLDEHDVILKEHSTILKEHSDIFKRNNLK